MSSAELDRIRSGSLSGSTVEFGKIISHDGATIYTGDLSVGSRNNHATIHVNGKDVTNTLIAGGTDHFDNGIYLKDANTANDYRRIYAYTTQQGDQCIRTDKECTFVAAELESKGDARIYGDLEICQTDNPVRGQPPISHEFKVNGETVVDDNNKGTFNGVNLKNGNYDIDLVCEDQSNRLKVNGVNIGNLGLNINGTGTNPNNMHMIHATGGGITVDRGTDANNRPIYYDLTLNNEKVLGGKREAYLEKIELYPSQGPGNAAITYDNGVKIDKSIEIGDATTQLTLKLNGNAIATKAAAFDGVLDKNDLKVGTAQNKKKVIVNGNDVITDDSKITAKTLVVTNATGAIGTTITSDKLNNTSMTGTINLTKLNVNDNTAGRGITNTKLFGDVEIGENNSQYTLKINGKELAPFNGTYTGNVTINGTHTVTQNSKVNGKLTIGTLEMNNTNILTETGKANLQSIKINDYTNKKSSNITCDDAYVRIQDDNKALSGFKCGHAIVGSIVSLGEVKVSSENLIVEKGKVLVGNTELKNFDGKLSGADLELDAGKKIKIGGVEFKPNFDGQLKDELHVIGYGAIIDKNLTVGDANNNSTIWLNGKTVLEGDSQADLKKITLISTKDNNKKVEVTYDQDYATNNRVNVNGDLFADALSCGYDDRKYDAARISGDIEIVTGEDPTTKTPIYRALKFNDKEVLTGKAHAHFNELEICSENDNTSAKLSVINDELRSEKPILIASTDGISISSFDDKVPLYICAQKIKYDDKSSGKKVEEDVLYTPHFMNEDLFVQNLLKIGDLTELKVIAGRTDTNDKELGVSTAMTIDDTGGISIRTDDTAEERYATLTGTTVTDNNKVKYDTIHSQMFTCECLKASDSIYIGDTKIDPNKGIVFDGNLPDNDLNVGKDEVGGDHTIRLNGLLYFKKTYVNEKPSTEEETDESIIDDECTIDNGDETITKKCVVGYNSKKKFCISSNVYARAGIVAGECNCTELDSTQDGFIVFGNVVIGSKRSEDKSKNDFKITLNRTNLKTDAKDNLIIENGGLNIPADKAINIGNTILESNESNDLIINQGDLRLTEGKKIYIGNDEFKGGETFDGNLPKNDLVVGDKDNIHNITAYGLMNFCARVETKDDTNEDDTIIKGNITEETTDENGYVIKSIPIGIDEKGKMIRTEAQFGCLGTLYAGGSNEQTKDPKLIALRTYGNVKIGDETTAYKLVLNGKEITAGSNVFEGKVVINNSTAQGTNDVDEYATLQIGNTEMTTDENNDMVIKNKLSLQSDGVTLKSITNPDVSVALSAYSQESSAENTTYKGLYAENFISENLVARNKVYTVENDGDGNKTKLVELKNFDGNLDGDLSIGDFDTNYKLSLNGVQINPDRSITGNLLCDGSLECKEMITIDGRKYVVGTDPAEYEEFKALILTGTNQKGDAILTVGSTGKADAPVTLVQIPTSAEVGNTDKTSTVTLNGTVEQNGKKFLDTDGNLTIDKIYLRHGDNISAALYTEGAGVCSEGDIRIDSGHQLQFQYNHAQMGLVNIPVETAAMKFKSGGTGQMGIYTSVILADTFHQQGTNSNSTVAYDMSYNPETNSCTNEDGSTTTFEEYPNTFSSNVVTMGSVIASGENNVIGVGLYDDKDKQTYMTATSLHTKRTYTDSITPVEDAISIGDSTTNYKLTLNGKNVQVAEGAEFTSLRLISEDGTKYVEVAKNASIDDGITVKGTVDIGSDLNVYGTVAAKKARIEALENLNTFTFTTAIKTTTDGSNTYDATLTVTLERIIGNLKRCTIKQTNDWNISASTWINSGGIYMLQLAPSESVPEDLKTSVTTINHVNILQLMKWNDTKTDWKHDSFAPLYYQFSEEGILNLMFMRESTEELACTGALSTISFFY